LKIGATLTVLVTTLLAAGPQAMTPVGLPIDQSSASIDDATARIVGSIITYSRWPVQRATLRVCVVPPAAGADAFDTLAAIAGRPISVSTVDSSAFNLSGSCDVLYIGGLNMKAIRQLTASVRGRATLTIAEADRDCRSEAMFCMLPGKDDLSFRLNVDAISRSKVRVDPRVLRISRSD
jgi:hypothetical protein